MKLDLIKFILTIIMVVGSILFLYFGMSNSMDAKIQNNTSDIKYIIKNVDEINDNIKDMNEKINSIKNNVATIAARLEYLTAYTNYRNE